MITVSETAPQRPPSHAYHGALAAPAHDTVCLVASAYAMMASVPTAKEIAEAWIGLAMAALIRALNAPLSGISTPARNASAIQKIMPMVSSSSGSVLDG